MPTAIANIRSLTGNDYYIVCARTRGRNVWVIGASYIHILKGYGLCLGYGEGPDISYCGGHCKIGELMARAVTLATKEAILKHSNTRSG